MGRGNRLFVTAVFYRARTEIPWRDLPARFGQWNTIARRFRRWALTGVWEAVFRAVQEPDYEWVLVDSTTVKAHKAAAGQKKYGPRRMPWAQSRGLRHEGPRRSRRAGQLPASGPDSGRARRQLPVLLAALVQPPGAVVCDKAYGTNNVLKAIDDHRATPVIPPKSTRLDQRDYDRNLYADRNKIERFFDRLKVARGFATCYEKTAVSFLATAHLLAALDWMR